MSDAERVRRQEAPGAPPAVDSGDPPGMLISLSRELRPTPGRLADTVRVTVFCLVAIGISEIFRTPMTVLTAALVFFMSAKDIGSSVLAALMMGVSALTGVLIALLVFSLSLSQPALRVPLIAMATFAAMFLSRASSLGPVFFVSGFVTAYALTFGDDVLGAALQPDTVGNTTQDGLPDLAFMPPVEALVQSILWIAVAVAIPALVVILGNLLIGRDPTLMLRSALADSMAAAARFCEGSEGVNRELETLARKGSDPLLKLHGLAAKLHGTARLQPPSEPLIFHVGRLLSILLAWERLEGHHSAVDALASTAGACRELERAIRRGCCLDRADMAAALRQDAAAVPSRNSELVWTLSGELRQVISAMRDELSPHPHLGSEKATEGPASPRQLLVSDAFSNPEHVRFALKVTLAMMGCYIFKDLTNWPGIQTCIVTCFLVALGTIGESTHKALLRLAGACIGGALGIGAILLVMPSVDGFGGLLALLTPVLLVSAWVASGSERISYCGMQIALGFLVAVLQGYGPTLDMQTARDRIIGVLLGDAAILAVFTTFWPVSVETVVRERTADALNRLADLMELPLERAPSLGFRADELRRQFGRAIAQGQSVLVNDPYDVEQTRQPHGRRQIDAGLLARIQDLVVPVSAIVADRRFETARDDRVSSDYRYVWCAHHQALSGWLRRCAGWVRTGVGGADVTTSLPEPPPGDAGWYGILHRDLCSIIETVGPAPASDVAPRTTGP